MLYNIVIISFYTHVVVLHSFSFYSILLEYNINFLIYYYVDYRLLSIAY